MLTWGYVLKAPGRPSLKTQVAFMKKAGLNVSEIGHLWIDEFAEGATRSKKSLTEREHLMRCALPGDTALVFEPYCLGIGVADARWFANELSRLGIKLIVGSEEIGADRLEAVLDEFDRQQGAYHSRLSRSGKPRRRRMAALRRAEKEGKKPPKPVEIPGAKRPCLYRHFDKGGALLYIGACMNYERRMVQHKCKSKWISKSARFTIEFYPSIAEAREAERVAIWLEKPLYNKQRLMPPAAVLIDEAAKMIPDPDVASRILSLKTAI